MDAELSKCSVYANLTSGNHADDVDTVRQATSDEVVQLREENRKLKETVADLVIRYDIVKKSLETLD